MNSMYKKTVMLSILAITCLTHNNIKSDDASAMTMPALSAVFEIKPVQYLKNPDPSKYYVAVITVTNNSPFNISHGWRLDFDFSSSDQKIYKIINGILLPSNENHISIKNIIAQQHIDRSYYIDSISGAIKLVPTSTNPRMVYMLISKQPGSTPIIPRVTATIL